MLIHSGDGGSLSVSSSSIYKREFVICCARSAKNKKKKKNPRRSESRCRAANRGHYISGRALSSARSNINCRKLICILVIIKIIDRHTNKLHILHAPINRYHRRNHVQLLSNFTTSSNLHATSSANKNQAQIQMQDLQCRNPKPATPLETSN